MAPANLHQLGFFIAYFLLNMLIFFRFVLFIHNADMVKFFKQIVITAVFYFSIETTKLIEIVLI